MQAVYSTWPALVSSLGQEAVQGNPTADGLAKKAETYTFLAYTSMLCDILPIFSKLSKVFQTSDLNMDMVTSTLASTRLTLESMILDRRSLPLYCSLYNKPAVNNEITFEGIQLKRSEDMMRRCEEKKNLLVTDLLANLERRFPEDGMASLSQLFSILSPTSLRAVPAEEIVPFGLDALNAISDKFEAAQHQFDFNRQRAQHDFLMYKHHARNIPAHFTFADFVADLCTRNKDENPDFALWYC